ncbi:MAG: alanyl-tRNA editing protein [Spirochaetaceae bacterium]|jgi:Ser-tRNA(Ala) deacylase AlaX|nr:alanyl-tRNA editing protein [Spirochaetaceae bacterium]
MENQAKSVKLFWEDPYAVSADVKITSAEGPSVTLDRTVGFAWPGGQLADTGTIGGWPILGAKYDGGEIYYTLDVGHRLKTGDTVTMNIDWRLRYIYMRLHFAAELAIVILHKHFAIAPELLVRADILSTKAALEYHWDDGGRPAFTNLAETFPVLERELRSLIGADHPIISGWLDRETEKRYWEIAGLAKVPCNGTHLRRTGEIGAFRLAYAAPAPDVEGVHIFLA